MVLWETFLLAFSALFPLINPFGTSLIFLGLVGDEPPEVYRSLARKVAVDTVIFLVVIELLGSAILNFFGISLPIVQFSGGIVICAVAWSMLNGDSTAAPGASDAAAHTSQRNKAGGEALAQMAFYPLTFPITAGPGTLVAMLTLSAHVSEHTLTDKILDMRGYLWRHLCSARWFISATGMRRGLRRLFLLRRHKGF